MNIVKKTLSNGLRIILVPQNDAATVTMLTLIGTGSNRETKRQNGLSHFLEHVCFKATTTRPNAKVINEQFEEIGAITNAFTSDEYTGYYAKSHPRYASRIVEMVGDIVCNATLPKEELEKEKGVIVEEINMYEDTPHVKVIERLETILFGDSAAGRSVIGTKESVRSFSRTDVVKYKSQYYNTKNTVVAVVGSFDEKTILQDIAKAFANFPKGEKHDAAKVRFVSNTPAVVHTTKPIDQTHLAIGFPSLPINHPDGAAAALLATILGGGMSSQLFHHLREELGVAYYVRAEHDAHSTHGEFLITAGVDTLRVEEVLEAIAHILKTIKTTLVDQKEFIKAREYTIGMLSMALETTDMVAGYVATQRLLTDKIKTPEMMIREYLKVTPQDIMRVAKNIFSSKKVKFSTVGPESTLSAGETPFLQL